jgi:hypothetical protein
VNIYYNQKKEVSRVSFEKRCKIMATVSNLSDSRLRRIIETSFYGNNVIKVNSLKEAYNLASNSPGTIITDQKILPGTSGQIKTRVI